MGNWLKLFPEVSHLPLVKWISSRKVWRLARERGSRFSDEAHTKPNWLLGLLSVGQCGPQGCPWLKLFSCEQSTYANKWNSYRAGNCANGLVSSYKAKLITWLAQCGSMWTPGMSLAKVTFMWAVHLRQQSRGIQARLAHGPIFTLFGSTLSGSISISLGEGVRHLEIVSINCPSPITWV